MIGLIKSIGPSKAFKGRDRLFNVLKSGWAHFFTPIKASLKVSTFIISKPLARFTDAQKSPVHEVKENFREYVGSIVGVIIIYICVALVMIAMSGIPIQQWSQIWCGPNWIVRLECLWYTLTQNIFTNLTFVGVYLSAVVFNAKSDFYQADHDNARVSGLSSVIPVGSWSFLNLKKNNVDILESSRKIHAQQVANEGGLVKIKLASGFDAIGSVENPGYIAQVLVTSDVKWQILLLDPESEGLRVRAKGYLASGIEDCPIKSAEEYSAGILRVINHLKQLKAQGRDVELRLYKHNPVWRLTILSGMAVVQSFSRGHRSDNSPMYFFDKTDTSLYNGFKFHFNEVWDESDVINLLGDN
ncbi:MAG: hypothetical protein EOP04_23570 [Proteobacteria bacterium]|nr:MAG: hypothetical protein EOP04_23570 [Pseudomonadota bacterium]